MGDNFSVIPQHTKTQLLATSMIDNFIFVFLPLLPDNKRIHKPGFPRKNGPHKEFQRSETGRDRPEDREKGFLAFEGVSSARVGNMIIRCSETIYSTKCARDSD
jgi:hypothetical protein